MERNYFKSLTDEERRQLKQNIFQRLNISDQDKAPAAIAWKRIMSIGIAACLVAAVAVVVFRTATTTQPVKILLASTKAGEIKQVILADSSVVILNPGSALYSNSDYSTAKREVFLEGNGFFKVKKLDSKQHFVVHANSLQVTVLGTQFNVNARSPQVEVSLTSGRVEVKEDGIDKQPEFMLPGDKLKLDNVNGSFERTQFDTSLYGPWIKGEWDFKNTSLGEIASLIKDYYGLTVTFKTEKTKNLRMTAVIPVTTIAVLKKVITETLPVQISDSNQQLFIQ
jgi:transmembrane sensor